MSAIEVNLMKGHQPRGIPTLLPNPLSRVFARQSLGTALRALRVAVLGVALLLSSPSQAQTPLRLGAEWDSEKGWIRFDSPFQTDTLLSLEATTDLMHWTAIATTHDGIFRYPDVSSAARARRFYRISSQARPPGHDWKNQILFPSENFRSTELEGGQLRWVKFGILLQDPVRVIYQHSASFPFHYDFLTQRVEAFRGLNRAEFDRLSLFRESQKVVLGAVLYPPEPSPQEYGIQLVGRDPYPPEEAARWLELVRASVYSERPATAFYVPTFEQRSSAEAERQIFANHGFDVTSVERWIELNHCYASGWAVGRLRFIPASEIEAAYADGRLGPSDILLTDGVPAETPLVAGIISLSPSTPNSHTAILAGSLGIPFVYFPDEQERQRIRSLAGKEILFSAYSEAGRCTAKVISLEGELTPEQRAELMELKALEPLQFAAKERYGQFSASTDKLGPSDIRYFGGKAANYGLLRRSVPAHCPAAIAFSFDLWDAFMSQPISPQRSLREEIAIRLEPFSKYPPDLPSLKTNLAAIRALIRNGVHFSLEQEQAITNSLAGFTAGRKIRFRSSTNVEDTENFTGAGLYDSYSGCLWDDLDGDATGPSHCDPTWTTERGVLRALQQVYASFYNDNAFLERLRHRVDESKVGMGVLVHHSFPDEEEMANGVASLRYEFSRFSTNVYGSLVSQIGALPVTNPEGDSLPEVVDASSYGEFSSFVLRQSSSKVPLGATVMDWEADYRGFLQLFRLVGQHYRAAFPAKSSFLLDFEYKKDTNRVLVVKQVRELPKPDLTKAQTTYLVNEPTTYQVAQQEFGDVFSNHRLKTTWMLKTHNTSLVPELARDPIYQDGSMEYLEGQEKRTLLGAPSRWPEAKHEFDSTRALTVDAWTTGHGLDSRRWQLTTELTLKVFGSRPPIVTQRDFMTHVWATYSQPQPTLDYEGKFQTTTQEVVRLTPIPELAPGAIRRQPVFTVTNSTADRVLQVRPIYYWPKPPANNTGGYTAPLIRFEETRIDGLASSPIVLRDYYSQTYRPGHHNFSEEFIFEPRLEPGLDSATAKELERSNIRLIHLHWLGGDNVRCTLLGLDGVFRKY